jgi:hypothetical protein
MLQIIYKHLETKARMGSEWILGRLAAEVYSGSSWFRIGAGGGLFENMVMNLWVLAPQS